MRNSIIIPTYNRGNYICKAIESVLQQTVSDLEIIVVDDGSTDDTLEKIQPYSAKIRYVKTENRGPSHARNVGMRLAVGDYISFLDSDDLYYPHKTELQSRILDIFPNIAMVSSEFSGFDDNGYMDEFHLRKYHRSGFEGGKLTFDMIYPEKVELKEMGLAHLVTRDSSVYFGNIFDTYFQYMVVCTNTIMFRRHILKKIGFQNELFRLAEEHNFTLRITKYYRVAFLDTPTYKLRYHGSQISDVSRDPTRKDGLDIVIERQRNLLQTSLQLGVNDPVYYSAHREMVDRRIVVLTKALAIPLMCRSDGAGEARKLYRLCRDYGQSEPILELATYLPKLWRKAAVKYYTIFKTP